MRYAIVDIETTGGSPKSSKITEIAIYKHNGIEVIDEFIRLVNPEMKIPPFIIRLTGITDKMVESAPKFYEIAKEIIEFTEDCVFVAHNVGFDYGIVRQEFKWLGYDFRKPHLCTVRAARQVLPGYDSYSLGKLSKSLGIEITDRHRAGGDALATAHLFRILYATDKTNLHNFIQDEINPKILHPNLDKNTLDEIPSKTGVYRFFGEENRIIYIGKSKQIKTRVDQHLRNTSSKKGSMLMKEITRIEYELTGSELIALLLESRLIKEYKPIYNRRLIKSKFPFGIYDTLSENGYLCMEVDRTANRNSIPLIRFTKRKEAMNYLEYLCETHALCQKLCGVYPSENACFHYSIKKCNGACVNEELVEVYNLRVQKVIDYLTLSGESFYIIERGRNKNEKSLILVERGSFCGFGFAPFNFQNQPIYKWRRYIDFVSEDSDARSILMQYLNTEKDRHIVRF
jgi:DNA polymerase-3 subunit epsilon